MSYGIRTRRAIWLAALLFGAPLFGYAEYHGFNTGSNSDGIIQEVRWPYWAESTYNAIYSQTLYGSDGGRCYFYGGMPSDPNATPPCSIIWSFWPPSGTAVPGAAVTAEWTGPDMFAPPHVGEGASGKVSGAWPIITTGRWYREVMRVWQPTDGTPNLGFIGRWLRDPDSGTWYHLATMRVPYAATGINALSGFQEDFAHRNRNPRRTDYRNVYFRQDGPWQMANRFTASVRQATERGTAELIEGETAAFFEVSMEPGYVGNLDYDAGQTAVTLTLANQPTTPPVDPIVVSDSGASVFGDQLITHWELPPTSSPQFAYRIDVFDNPGYAGSPALTFFDIDPEARQKLLDVSGIATPYVRLTITDVLDIDHTPILLTPAAAVLQAASTVPGAVNGLDYQYFESGSDFTVLPDFSTLTPVLEGAVNYPDLTLRDQRDHYAFRYAGYLDVPSDGLYTFTLYSSDGSKLLIDGATVVDWDGRHSPGPMSGWIALHAGKHAVELQYFFDQQNGSAGDLIDSLSLSWTGPGIVDPVALPVSAWYRVPTGGEPAVTLISPTHGTSVSGADVMLRADVTPNGASVEKVRFYIGETYWGEDDTAPYELNTFMWAAPDNPIHARVFYDAGWTIDSAQSIVTTTNMPLAPWENHAMSEHTYPQGARTLDGTHTLIGDGLNFLGRQVSGDCTLLARVSDLIDSSAGPDGEDPSRSWEAGIIMRETAVSTPGTPLGNNSSAQYAAVFATVNNDTRYQDGTMSNAGGPYWSGGLGGQRWLKLQRTGNTFTTYVSTDGSSWTQVNSVELSGISSTLYVGMFTYAASSRNPNVHWAEFDSVSLAGDVTGPPDVTVAPQSTTAYSGQSAMFTALPAGQPPFTYQWQYNGADLVGETAATLNLANVQPTDSGLYTVVMTSSGGSASSTAELTVLTPLPTASEVLAKNPLSYWRLNDPGPIAEDAVGSNDGTGQGGVLFGAEGVGTPFDGFESDNLAAEFNGADSAVAIPPSGVTTTHFTITGWVKRNGSQINWAGLVFSRSSGRGAGIMLVNNALRFSWNDNGTDYNWNSGLTLPDGQWAFFALTIEPTGATLYRSTGGALSSASRAMTLNPLTLDSSFYMGYDPNSSARRFKGAIDEVALYNRTLSQAEIQEILDASLVSAPEVTLTAPADGDVMFAPADITVAADVDANGHTISSVRFYHGSTLLGEDTTAPYSLDWNGVSSGYYTLVAEAVYEGGNTMSSLPVNISARSLPGAASAPVPVDGAIGVPLDVLLHWSAGSMASSHDVYFGTSTRPVLQANVSGTTFSPGPLSSGTAYYWAVDEVNDFGTAPGPVWSFSTVGDTISLNFEQGSAETFSGGQLIGPLTTDSTHWNAGSGESSSLADLLGSTGAPTGVEARWRSANTWGNNDGTADDEHRLSVGYLDDGTMGSGRGLTVTLVNIPYTMYRVYGLFATDQNGSGSCGVVNADVNGTWALGGDASTTAAAWGSIGANHAANGVYWTEIEPGVTQGNYWTVVTAGSTCRITMEDRDGSNRGCLTGVIIEEIPDHDGDGIPDGIDPDDDNDGIPDDWEISHGLDPLVNDAADDPDLDGDNNGYEYVADTHPRDGESKQTFSIEMAQGSGDPALRFSSSSDRRYVVEHRTDLDAGMWEDLDLELPGSGSEMTVEDDAGGPWHSYRLRIGMP